MSLDKVNGYLLYGWLKRLPNVLQRHRAR